MERKFTDQELIRRQKLKELQEMGKNPYEVESVVNTINTKEFLEKFDHLQPGEHDSKQWTISGRVIALRQTFGVIKDFFGKLQFYVNKSNLEQQWEFIKKYLDIGDIVKIDGNAFRTHKNEVTINVANLEIISKALKPLPEKWHGLQDEELRARNRYVDLITNDESMQTFVKRSQIIKIVRNYLDDNGYFEVETPVLNPILGGAAARPFITHHNALDRDYYLRIATELPLKKLVVGGFEKVYEIGRIFRNEGMDSTHNPEFTSIEIYTAYSSMDDTMVLVENIIHEVAKKLNVKTVTLKDDKGNDVVIDIAKSFKKIHMVDFIKEVTGVDFHKITKLNEALEVAKKHNVHVEKHQMTVGHIINLFFEEFCEAHCIQPTFVWGHPVEISPLSKKDYSNPRFSKRFELFINKKEISNAFAELNDPIDQYERFEAQLKEKELGNEEANEMDHDFINALEYGLPPTGGIGIGIDRLVMLFTEKQSIRDVLLFPHMKDKV